jgi:Ca-activated chloride channel family protein
MGGRVLALAAIAASGATGLGIGGAPAAQPVVFRSGIDLVHFAVVVQDRRGNFVTDLGPDDFEIYEEGRRQTLQYFARGGEAEGPRLPRHLGLLFDTSGSMERDIETAKSAAIKFLNTIPHADDITLVDFATEVRVARFSAADFPRLVERLRSRKTEGWTALYDALGVYLDGAAAQDGEKILVLYTDGGDTRSALGFGELMDLVRAADVTIYAVGFLENQPSSTRLDQKMKLQQITEATGGQAFFPLSLKDLDPVYERLAAELKARYSLGYVSSDERADGAWRSVEIKLRSDRRDLRGLKVRTRKGYFAPYRPRSH